MMRQWLSRCGIFLAGCVLLTAGCRKHKAPEAPLEEVKLMDRLCTSMQAGRYEESLVILDKLDAISPDDAVLGEMRVRIASNASVKEVQSALDKGDVEGALKLTDAAIKKYPSIARFKMMAEELRSIIALKNASKQLAEAKTSDELAMALTVIEPLAAAHPEAKQLAQDIKVRRSELAKLRATEAKSAKSLQP